MPRVRMGAVLCASWYLTDAMFGKEVLLGKVLMVKLSSSEELVVVGLWRELLSVVTVLSLGVLRLVIGAGSEGSGVRFLIRLLKRELEARV